MSSPDDGDDEGTDSFAREAVERRDAPRGMLPGLTIRLTDPKGGARTFDVIEASRKSLFIATETPEGYPLNEILVAEIAYNERRVQCRVKLVRAESSAPRRGFVATVFEGVPIAEEALHELLREAEVPSNEK